MCDKLSEMHHVVSPLSSTDDENDENSNELMESERHITVSSPASASSESSLQSSPQTKPLSTAESMQSKDEHEEDDHQTENGMHFILNRKNIKVIKLL